MERSLLQISINSNRDTFTMKKNPTVQGQALRFEYHWSCVCVLQTDPGADTNLIYIQFYSILSECFYIMMQQFSDLCCRYPSVKHQTLVDRKVRFVYRRGGFILGTLRCAIEIALVRGALFRTRPAHGWRVWWATTNVKRWARGANRVFPYCSSFTRRTHSQRASFMCVYECGLIK